MARLQILELPEGSGDDRPPFALVVDQCMPQRIALGADAPYRDYWQDLADKIGARGVIATPETIDIPANDVQQQIDHSIQAATAGLVNELNRDPAGADPKLAGLVFETLGIEMTPDSPPPDEVLHKACRELEKSEAARAHLRSERARQAAELEQLRAGEEPVTDTAVRPSPGQWIWQWNRATPEKRLSMAAQILEGMAKANDCWMNDHQARLADLQAEVQRLRPQPDGAEKPDA